MFSLTTKAERRSGGYLLNGQKTFATNAPVADLALAFAYLQRDGERPALTAFLVPRGTSGVTFGRPISKMGLRTSPMGEVIFDDCFVPESARLGPEGTLVVLSDHGFAPYYRSFNLNTWLLNQGYVALKPGTERSGDFFAHVDWARTRAYGLGLNGLYLNLRGRETRGMVAPEEADALSDRIAEGLQSFSDAATGAPLIRP